ncbi:hypothetical protein QC761_504830 [Podospora bellae-mahoneyi]|uniref:Uncharacterized protein n=1 Tax=Podospora bellae-mahoneyi TaxID=2093777 RepID=A0ABR0FEQ6_9PEZI|nr:hypothetical protein QC761_504830 [Podospora bellae-mahoneyi]
MYLRCGSRNCIKRTIPTYAMRHTALGHHLFNLSSLVTPALNCSDTQTQIIPNLKPLPITLPLTCPVSPSFTSAMTQITRHHSFPTRAPSSQATDVEDLIQVEPIPIGDDPLPPYSLNNDHPSSRDTALLRSDPKAPQVSVQPPREEVYNGPPRLHILAAAWGGVIVTPTIKSLIRTSPPPPHGVGCQILQLEMRNMHSLLQPDPASGTYKVFSLVYRYDGDEYPTVMNLPETIRPSLITIAKPSAVSQLGGANIGNGGYRATITQPWRSITSSSSSSGPKVEILAVFYGKKRIEHPAVLEELANYFEGRTRQIRMTNTFFRGDTWPYTIKSWTVYFRFVGSRAGVQVVTGWENQALEQPWTRD